ncbi:hypothetical protein [Mycolicibacterium sphagni]|uniref:Uncharacterized protein n=1 Tax=Mycolicibacterium sphagni TaxID=1786 RepID=A0A255DQQ3_9MYCO|nr:hypothetical protein [Mycolicibacterium sphagni]OYN79555.1 hypothetical protein CG716_11665 [Mycolicibacterium sphagni]
MNPFFVQSTGTVVEVWSGYRIQFEGMERQLWQKELKSDLQQALSRLTIPPGVPLAGFYDTTDPGGGDPENSLFTNSLESMPRGVSMLRFERGTSCPPKPPVPIELVGGHLHYYRYEVGGFWTRWQPDQTIASWDRIPRRLPDDGSARPVWFALREAIASGLVSTAERPLAPHMAFGIRLTVHATNRGPRDAIRYSEKVVDGTIAAFHDDRCSDDLVATLARKLPSVTEKNLRLALDHSASPIFSTPAIRTNGHYVQISPDDERCIVGEVNITKDSKGQWPELSGALFTVRPTVAC